MEPKDQVKQQIDIVDFIGQYLPLKTAGRNFRGLCPFHNEKSPSFHVSSEMQIYKCFGCGEAGDIFSFYMKQEGVSFPEALHDLAKVAGVSLADYTAPSEFEDTQRWFSIYEISKLYYHYLLTQHSVGKKALEYIQQRGVSASQIKEFQLGYAPDSWTSLSDFLIKKKHFQAQELDAIGLLIHGQHNRYYDRFRGRIIFPLNDLRGNTVGFSGRVLPWTDDGKTGKYINSPETPIYHKGKMLFALEKAKEAARKKKQVIIVEGELDVLASRRAGILETVAVKGTALTIDQLRLLKRYCTTVILALDADEAGIQAAKKAIGSAQQLDMNVRVVELQAQKDPDELVKTDSKQWRQLVKQATHAYDFFMEVALRTYSPHTVEGKQAISKELVPILSQTVNTVVQAHYVQKLAHALSLEERVIYQEIDRYQKHTQVRNLAIPKTVPKTGGADTRLDKLLQEMLEIVVHYFSQLDVHSVDLEDMPPHAITRLMFELKKTSKKDPIEMVRTLPEELKMLFQEAFLKDQEDLSEKQVKERFAKLQTEVADLYLRDKLGQLRRELQYSDSTDTHRKLLDEISAISQKRQRYIRS